MKISRSRALVLLGVIMLIGAAVFEGIILGQNYQSEKRANDITVRLEGEIDGGGDEPDGSDGGIAIDSVKYCGILEIPKIKLSLPVSSEYSFDQMTLSLCRYRGTLPDKNMIICGHNRKPLFGSLHNVFEGDSVYFTDCSGTRYEFEVNETLMIDGYDAAQLKSGDWDLSLFTCNYSASKRYVVRCRLK